MKPETVDFLRGAGWALVCVLCTFLLWAVTSPARAQGVEEKSMAVECDPKTNACTVSAAELYDLIQNNNRAWEIAARAAQRVKELEMQIKAPPQCATVEVVPKKPEAPQNPALKNFKKDRDT